ncbi:hypothetical protein LINPERHAP2_LOCUS1953 [Linum perenne]
MSRKIPQLWAKKGRIQVSDVGWGHFVVRFETKGDHERAMFGGPWMVGDHYVVIQEWRPYFQPDHSPISTLRVWVRLPGLPLEYFDVSVLTIIGNKIGKIVRLDHTTLEGSRGNFARICVEVELSKPLLSKYRLRRRVRRIEYEGLHTICYSCGCYGHAQDACTKKTEEVGMVEPEGLISNPIFQSSGFEEICPEVEEDFGPWMKVSRPNRKGKKNVVAIPAKRGASPAVSTTPVGEPSVRGNKFEPLLVEDSLVKDSLEAFEEKHDPIDKLYGMGNKKEGNNDGEDHAYGMGNKKEESNDGEDHPLININEEPLVEDLQCEEQMLKSDVAADSKCDGPKGGKVQPLIGAKSVRADSTKGQLRVGLAIQKPKVVSKPGSKKSSLKGNKQEGEAPKPKSLPDPKQLKVKSPEGGSVGPSDLKALSGSSTAIVDPEIVLVEDITMGEALAD